MTDEPTDGIPRRLFLKGAGTTAAAATLGVGATGSAGAHGGFHTEFAFSRVRAAAKVWERGYRGRPDRTVAIDDSGIDHRHPDVGPWNRITAVAREVDDSNDVPDIDVAKVDALESWDETRTEVSVGENVTTSQTAVLGPGTAIEGSETTFPPFEPPEGEGIVQLDAALSWTPPNVPLPEQVPIFSEAGEDQSFRIQINLGTPEEPEWFTLQTIDTGTNPERLTRVPVQPGRQHRFVAGQFANVAAQGEVSWTYYSFEGDLETLDPAAVFDDSGSGPAPKTLGWFDAGDRYGQSFEANDPDGHGSHVSGIVAGSGRASAVDPERYVEESPQAVLTAGDVLTYEVEADPGTGVFGVATGEGVETVIEGPTGQELRSSGVAALGGGDKEALPIDDARVDHPTVDERHPVRDGERQPATYKIHVRPSGGEAASTGRVQEVAVGAFRDPASTEGDRSAGDPSMYSGLAPDSGLFGMQGLSGPAASLAIFGEQLTPLFNVRAINMSWSGLLPGGGAIGGSSEEVLVKTIAEHGVLTVAAAGNDFGAPTGTPAIADEALAVTATNYVDGVTAYTSGGTQAQDEDGGTYGKPDLCAPGGSYEAGARSVEAKAEDDNTPGTDGVRDYESLPGTSMASPYACGVAALVAQAMEEDAPDDIRLPSPSALHEEHTAEERLQHVLRLKSVLLGTASTTAFNAAPYHRHPVRYVHDGRDTYEGYGRVNPDAAVDALTRDLFAEADGSPEEGATAEATHSGRVGVDVPDDPRAFAGYVRVPAGTLDVSMEHATYSGGNAGMTKGAPHLDLFVYDAEEPLQGGDPNALASAQGSQGSASVSVDVAAERDDPSTPGDEAEYRTLFVVVKLVDVPGVVNGYDVRSVFDVDLAFEATGDLPLPEFSASGSRSDDGSVFTQGGTDRITVTVDDFSDGVTQVGLTDEMPEGWALLPYGDSKRDERVEGPVTVDLGSITEQDLQDAGDEGVTRTYFVEATGSTGRYTFGPATATVEEKDDGVEFSDDETAEVGGTDTNTIVGADQSDAPL
jgi:subtilisin family serine protease